MKKIIGKLYVLFAVAAVMLFSQSQAFAKVYMPGENVGAQDVVLVAGLDDFYPVEYYDKGSASYKGIMPDILNDISIKTGIDFKYINTGGKIRAELAEQQKCHIFSSYIVGQTADWAKDITVAFSYSVEHKPVDVGWAFSSLASPELIAEFKEAANSMTPEEINGYIISASAGNHQSIPFYVILILICVVVFLVLLLGIKLRKAGKLFADREVTDSETGIGNLTYFENCFSKAITQISQDEMYVAYFIINSNQLRFYHGDGMFTDAVRYTAKLLQENSKHHDFAARITENGFAFAFTEDSEKEAMLRVSKITDMLNSYAGSDERNSKPVVHSVLCNLKSLECVIEVILFNLRKNCNKIIGTDTSMVFCDDYAMNSSAEEQKLTEDILKGFENEEFKLYVQFIVDNKTKDIVSAEALSRWEKPGKGVLPPGAYIKIMEDVGLIANLDYYMFGKACMQLHKWKNSEFSNLSISCNFTRLTISEPNFVERIKEISGRYIFDRSKLIMEITEDVMEKNREMASENILECKKLGFSIALDDMGSGYTSLRNLSEYPIDVVKIDRDILLNAEDNKGKDLFLGIIALAHSLKLKVVCEGVENDSQNDFVSSTDCEMVQGWYFSKPMSVNDCEEFARKSTEDK